jgi:hypothetical protein
MRRSRCDWLARAGWVSCVVPCCSEGQLLSHAAWRLRDKTLRLLCAFVPCRPPCLVAAVSCCPAAAVSCCLLLLSACRRCLLGATCCPSPPHGVCIYSCVDAFTHAHASDPCPQPVCWPGIRQGAGVRQACFCGSVGAPGNSTHAAIHQAAWA